MNEIIHYSLLILLAVLIFRLLRFVAKRLSLLIRLLSLKRATGAKIRLHAPLLRPMWAARGVPDLTVQILDTVYRIRLFSGGGISRSVHFSDRCWAVIYSKMNTATVAPRRGAARIIHGATLNVGARVIYLPEMPRVDDGRTVDVLLFNPAPAEVSYVSDEGNSVRLAFTGDGLRGYTVFTASTFVRYAERRYREEKEKTPTARLY